MMQKEPSEVLSEFLNFLDECEIRYQTAHEAVGLEDRRLQDLLHEMEFAEGFSRVGEHDADRRMKYRSWKGS